jgi:hypothetical protein
MIPVVENVRRLEKLQKFNVPIFYHLSYATQEGF